MTSKIVLTSVFLLFVKVVFSQVAGITSSNLPLVIINTNGQTIAESGKITAKMKIIFAGAGKLNKPTDTGNIYDGYIGIAYRGSIAPLEQNPYNFETRDASGANLNVSLLGMPAENDWVLLANYNDKTFIRNELAFQLFRKLGHYAPRTKMVEVIVNNVYQGVYILTEKIKQDKGRVNISKLSSSSISGDNLTGGYLFKIDTYGSSDNWQSSYKPIDHPDLAVHYVYDDPDAASLAPQQKDYLKSAVNSFESVLYGSGFANPTTGYLAWIKMNSFLDFFIVSEVSRNMNAFKKNCYFFKDKNSKDSKFHAGPVWDFYDAFKNLNDCDAFNANDGSGWSYKINDCPNIKTYSNGWMVRLLQDPSFANSLNTRYFLMRNSFLSTNYLNHFIDSVQNQAEEAQVRHYAKWDILSTATPPETYEGQVAKLKNWIQTRLTWLDAHIPGIETSAREIESGFSYRIFPNPATDQVYLESSSKIQSISIYRGDGICVVHKEEISAYSIPVSVSAFSRGIYLVQLKTTANQTINSKLVLQ